MRITKAETAAFLALAGIISACLTVDAKTVKRAVARRKPGATATLNIGDVVTVGGVQYTVAATLVPINSNPTPIPIPTPTPTPTPIPIPTPTPFPAPDLVVFGYRDSNRNWATVFGVGQTAFIEGKGFGVSPGTVSVNHQAVTPLAWSDTEIKITTPPLPTGAVGGPVPIDIVRSDHGSFDSTSGFVLIPAPTRFGNR